MTRSRPSVRLASAGLGIALGLATIGCGPACSDPAEGTIVLSELPGLCSTADAGQQQVIRSLAAAKDEAVTAEARLLRRGKAMCFAEVDVATEDGKPIAHATTMVRGRFGAEPPVLAASAGDAGESEPGPMGPLIGRVAFIGNRGIVVEHMTGGRSRLVMPLRDGNRNEDGGVHEGAVLALVDTAGAMAAWAETGPGPYRASTPSIQAQILAPPTMDDLVAYGRTVQRDRELLWADVEVADRSDGRLWARGTVVYRILT